MGSFPVQCALSGLPITYADPVLYFLLTESPYGERRAINPTDLFFPRSLPVIARYNDYGSIKDVDEKGPGVVAIQRCLAKDMVERGTGNNTCHDVPTGRGMRFGRVLEAIWEGRLQVTREFDTFWEYDEIFAQAKGQTVEEHRKARRRLRKENVIPSAVPTRKRVERLLDQALLLNKLPEKLLAPPKEPEPALLVDSKGYGQVRVRAAGYGDPLPALEEALPTLQKRFAAVLTVGSGSYADRAEIRVLPDPRKVKKDEHVHLGRDTPDRKKPLHVSQAMIRMDVLERVTREMRAYTRYDKKKWLTFEDFLADASACWAEALEKQDNQDPLDRLRLRESDHRERPVKYLLEKDPIPFSMGPALHFEEAVRAHRETPFTQVQRRDFFMGIALLAFLSDITPRLGYYWRPSHPIGPQWAEWEEHQRFHTLIAKAAAAEEAERRKEMGDDE